MTPLFDLQNLSETLQWLEKTVTDAGAKTGDSGFGIGGIDLEVELNGRHYSVNMRPRKPIIPGVHPERPYAAIRMAFVNRDDGKVKTVMCYPVERVELLNVFDDRMPEPARKFRVDGQDGVHGVWAEEQ